VGHFRSKTEQNIHAAALFVIVSVLFFFPRPALNLDTSKSLVDISPYTSLLSHLPLCSLDDNSILAAPALTIVHYHYLLVKPAETVDRDNRNERYGGNERHAGQSCVMKSVK